MPVSIQALLHEIKVLEKDSKQNRGFELSIHDALEDHLYKLLNLSIEGIEVTQAIQHYRSDEHLTNPSDQAPDNAVTIVAHKPAWVRVYLSARYSDIADVTGSLRVYRRSVAMVWEDLGELLPETPGTTDAVVNPNYQNQRENLDRTLNFVVPADWMCGTMRFEVQTESPSGYEAAAKLDVNASLQQTLSVRIVPVAYDGPDAAGTGTLVLPAPDLAAAQAETSWALRIYPVQATPDVSLTAQVELDFPLTGAPGAAGGCAASWIDLNVMVAAARTADGNLPGVFYYGLVAAGVPLGANSGCASSGVSSGIEGRPHVLAHELGHNLGFDHAPCGPVGGSADPNYTQYEPYPNASIGEYGLDIDDGTIHSPAAVLDYMAYCGPEWISLYHYDRCINHPRLSPESVCQPPDFYEEEYDPWWWLKRPIFDEVMIRDRVMLDPREQVISIIGVRHASGKIEVRSVRRALAAPTVPGEATNLVAEAFGAKGESLASATVFRLAGRGHGCGCEGGCESGSWPFQALIPVDARDVKVDSLRMSAEGRDEVWRSQAPERELQQPKLSARLMRGNRVMRVQWTLGRRDRKAGVTVRYRHAKDLTKQTRVLALGRGSGRADVDLSKIPPGRVHIEVVVEDGFNEVVSKAVALSIPSRPSGLAIVSPSPDRVLRAGGRMRLHGLLTNPDGTPASGKGCRWRLDGKVVGEGLDCRIDAPKAGVHTLVLDVPTKGKRRRVRSVKREFKSV